MSNPNSARTILSTISGAMIGVAGTVFSVTLVALTLASSQLGPRLIRNFMYVRLNQIVLGSYISTYLYCLLVLNAIKEGESYVFTPSISILLAILAAIANIVLLIIFIHRIAVNIQADKVISDISDLIFKQVKHLFPEKMGDDGGTYQEFDIYEVKSAYPVKKSIKAPRSGYLQYLDGNAILQLVAEHKGLFILHERPGSFLIQDKEIGQLYLKEFDDQLADKIQNQLFIGKTKTAQQDLEYSIHQMVEIASRALSPGVNDPFTAIACIDHLSSTVCYLAQAKFPSANRVDEDGELRVVADVLNFEGVLAAAFNQIRQFSVGSPAVMIRLFEALMDILSFTWRSDQVRAVSKHAQMVLSMAEENMAEINDLKDLRMRTYCELPS